MENTNDKNSALFRTSKSKAIMIGIIISSIVLIVFMIFLFYNSKSSKIKRAIVNFNQGVEWSEERSKYFWYSDSDYEFEEIDNQLAYFGEKLGLKESSFKYTDNIYSEITADFMNEYVQKYSFDKLIYGLSMLEDYLTFSFKSEHTYSFSDIEAKYFVINNDFYNEYKDRFTDTSKYTLNSKGYYTENPNAIPQPSSEQKEVSGKFNNASDGNSVYSRTESFTDTTKVYYYGDFAISETTTHGYDEGTYGWYGGEFIDKPAHFTTNTYYTLYYKGTKTSIDIDSTELPKLNLYLPEDKEWLYIIYESTKYSDDYDFTDDYEYHEKTGKIPLNIMRIKVNNDS
ncbi:MAG: hypothetical protein IK080_01590 [Clostridia bacterium]|nr:hypothetical protein [Clostridia bacterium]